MDGSPTDSKRPDLHRIVDALPEADVQEGCDQLAEVLRRTDPVLAAFLRAPYDDEPVTEDDLAEIAEAEAEVARGEVIPWEEYKRLRPKPTGR